MSCYSLFKQETNSPDVNVDNTFALLQNLNMPEDSDDDRLSKIYAFVSGNYSEVNQ